MLFVGYVPLLVCDWDPRDRLDCLSPGTKSGAGNNNRLPKSVGTTCVSFVAVVVGTSAASTRGASDCWCWRMGSIATNVYRARKLQHDLYDRRYAVFQAVRRFLNEASVRKIVSDETVRSFVLGTSDATFLFDDKLAAYLTEIREHAAKA